MAKEKPEQHQGGETEAVAGKSLLDQAREAFGLATHEVMAHSVKGDVVTIVTIGAHKVRWKPGDEVQPLHPLHAGRSIKPVAPPRPE